MQTIRTIITLITCLSLFGCNEKPKPKIEQKPVLELPVQIPEPAPEVPVQDTKHYFGKTRTPLLETEDEGKFKNLQIVSGKLNDLVMEPGSKFSFNKFIGKRTKENGFVDGGIIFEGIKQKGIGGGVCQGATTLYSAALLAGLEITERSAHSRTVSYNEPGVDAAVSWPDQCSEGDVCPFIDLKFKNPHPFKVTLSSIIIPPEQGGGLEMEFYSDEDPGWRKKIESKWGTAKHFQVLEKTKPWLPENYRKKMQDGEDGVLATTHLITFIGNEEVSRTKTTSLYLPKDEVWYVR